MVQANYDVLIEEFLSKDGTIYSVREDGTIWTKLRKQGLGLTDTWRRLDRLNQHGYTHCRYRNTYILTHRIVYAKYIGKLDINLQINHKNGIKNDNSLSNLELVDQSENLKHRYRILNVPASKGYKKINDEIANKIREDYASKDVSLRDLAEEYNLCKSTISYIVNYRTWK